MLVHPQFNPVALALGPVQIHWYGLTYLVAFALFMALANARARQPAFAHAGWTRREVEDLLFWGVLGVVLGGRLGYALFYKPGYYLGNPTEILAVWKGGMSFHGGMLGVIVAMAAYARSRGRSWLEVTDLIAPCVPTGLASGRIGNFINGELWGKPTDFTWAFVVDGVPRHASQLYEGALEGVVLFIILWTFTSRARPRLAPAGLFLLCYGCFRFLIEFVRVPDLNRGYLLFDWVTMGQILSLPMILAGLALLVIAYLNHQPSGNRMLEPQAQGAR